MLKGRRGGKRKKNINFHLIYPECSVQIKRVRAYPGTGCTAPTERGCRGGGGRWVNSFLGGKKKEGEQKEVVVVGGVSTELIDCPEIFYFMLERERGG